MGLSLLNPIQDPQAEIRRLQQEIFTRNRQLAEAEDALRVERQKNAGVEAGVHELRAVLNPLYQALQHIYGEMNAFGEDQAPATVKHSAVWESWKAKLGGQTAEAIDVLMLHKEMNAEQLRVHLHCARTHVYNVISRLNKAGIINKNGGKISLKEL